MKRKIWKSLHRLQISSLCNQFWREIAFVKKEKETHFSTLLDFSAEKYVDELC